MRLGSVDTGEKWFLVISITEALTEYYKCVYLCTCVPECIYLSLLLQAIDYWFRLLSLIWWCARTKKAKFISGSKSYEHWTSDMSWPRLVEFHWVLAIEAACEIDLRCNQVTLTFLKNILKELNVLSRISFKRYFVCCTKICSNTSSGMFSLQLRRFLQRIKQFSDWFSENHCHAHTLSFEA